MIAATVPQMSNPDHASLGMIAAARAEAMNWSAIANGLNEYGAPCWAARLPSKNAMNWPVSTQPMTDFGAAL
jgi:hypothetical protein